MSAPHMLPPCDLDAIPDDCLTFDGIPSHTILGTTTVWAACSLVTVVVYSGPALVDYFMADGMDEDEAREYIDFNMAGAFVGPHPPLILWP